MAEADYIELVYDGDCPFCSASAHMVRLKQAVGQLRIHNARDITDTPLMAQIRAQGFDLNQGIIVSYQDRLYHGEDALYLLALLGSENGWLNRLNVALFRNRRTVALAYPFLKAVRSCALFLNGKKPI